MTSESAAGGTYGRLWHDGRAKKWPPGGRKAIRAPCAGATRGAALRSGDASADRLMRVASSAVGGGVSGRIRLLRSPVREAFGCGGEASDPDQGTGS